jgi:hypothetical protein
MTGSHRTSICSCFQFDLRPFFTGYDPKRSFPGHFDRIGVGSPSIVCNALVLRENTIKIYSEGDSDAIL